MKAWTAALVTLPFVAAGCLDADAGSLSKSGCELESGDPAQRGPTTDGAGTIKYLDFEGGFFGIVTDDGRNLDPVNLCDAFKEDGLRVSFEGWELTAMGGIHMWGTYVELSHLEAA